MSDFECLMIGRVIVANHSYDLVYVYNDANDVFDFYLFRSDMLYFKPQGYLLTCTLSDIFAKLVDFKTIVNDFEGINYKNIYSFENGCVDISKLAVFSKFVDGRQLPDDFYRIFSRYYGLTWYGGDDWPYTIYFGTISNMIDDSMIVYDGAHNTEVVVGNGDFYLIVYKYDEFSGKFRLYVVSKDYAGGFDDDHNNNYTFISDSLTDFLEGDIDRLLKWLKD